MWPLRRHLDDDDLLAELFPASGADRRRSGASARHLRRCVACAARRAEFERLLEAAAAAHDEAFETVFPPARLAAVQARIVRRLERAADPPRAPRILRFPARGERAAPARRQPAHAGLLGALDALTPF